MVYKRQAQWVSFLPTLGARTWSISVLYLHPDRLLAEPHMELKYHLGSLALNPRPIKRWDKIKLSVLRGFFRELVI